MCFVFFLPCLAAFPPLRLVRPMFTFRLTSSLHLPFLTASFRLAFPCFHLLSSPFPIILLPFFPFFLTFLPFLSFPTFSSSLLSCFLFSSLPSHRPFRLPHFMPLPPPLQPHSNPFLTSFLPSLSFRSPLAPTPSSKIYSAPETKHSFASREWMFGRYLRRYNQPHAAPPPLGPSAPIPQVPFFSCRPSLPSSPSTDRTLRGDVRRAITRATGGGGGAAYKFF